MSTAQHNDVNELEAQNMREVFERQRSAFRSEGEVTYATRIDRLERLKALIVENNKEFALATKRDFNGARSYEFSLFTEFAGKVQAIDYAIEHLEEWMKPEGRKSNPPMDELGGNSQVRYFPKGVIGIISPWNLPFGLTVAPLTSALAAGNRALLKPSEFVPETAALFAEVIPKYFSEDEVAVVTGGEAISQDFAELPFDHLFFTGSTRVGAHVMRSAAKNLVPVTLELGGKSPVIIGRSADIKLAARNVMTGNTMNAGQICLAPDYVMVPEEDRDEFVEAARTAVTEMYPNLKDNEDYTSIINERHYDRLQNYLTDAQAKGAEIVAINPANEDFSQQEHHRIPPTLVLNPTDDMLCMQEEIFGPLLPVKTYQDVSETIGYVNDHDRPLGLYYFGHDQQETRRVLDQTTSGGVTLNDVIMHIAQEELPFGGVGPSGMGSYHGIEGFKTFSHAKSVYKQTASISKLMAKMGPPYKKKQATS